MNQLVDLVTDERIWDNVLTAVCPVHDHVGVKHTRNNATKYFSPFPFLSRKMALQSDFED